MASASTPVTLRAQQLKIAAVVTSYFVISIALVFVNKVLLTEGASIPAPLFVTWYQCIVTVGILWALGEAGKKAAPGSFFAQFPPLSYDFAVAKRLLPLSVIFVGMIVFNNLSLKYVEVSFYNVARSLTIVFNVLLTFFMLGETTSLPVLATLGITVVGFFVGSKGEVRFSWIGTIFGVTSSLFVALNGIFTKKGMAAVEGNQWRLSAYNNINACLLFVPLMLLTGESSIVSANSHLLASATFWGVMTVGGVFGFAIGIATIAQISVTSPLTHNISGTAKACVQTVMALYIWGNPTTFENLLGTAMVLLGSLAYSWVRNREMEAARARSKANPPAVTPSASSTGSAGATDAEASSASATAERLPGEGASGGAAGAAGDEEVTEEAEDAPLVPGGQVPVVKRNSHSK